MEADPIQSLLPWRHPMRMIDRMTECVPHERVVTTKRVTGSDATARGRSRGEALLPEVLVLEGMGQSASLLHQMTYGKLAPSTLPMLGFLKATFSGGARAGDSIDFTVRAVKMTATMGLFQAWAHVDGEPIAQAEFALGVGAGGGPEPAEGGR